MVGDDDDVDNEEEQRKGQLSRHDIMKYQG